MLRLLSTVIAIGFLCARGGGYNWGVTTINPPGGDTRVVLDGAALYVIAHTDLLGGFWSNPGAMQSLAQ